MPRNFCIIINQNRMRSFALAIVAATAQAALPTADLAGCQEFVKTFDNTCETNEFGNPVAYDNFLSLSTEDIGVEMSCTGEMRCPNGSGTATYDSSSPCTWKRTLCVTCYEEESVVKVKVQGNSLPNHCMNSVVNNASEMVTEWTVVW